MYSVEQMESGSWEDDKHNELRAVYEELQQKQTQLEQTSKETTIAMTEAKRQWESSQETLTTASETHERLLEQHTALTTEMEVRGKQSLNLVHSGIRESGRSCSICK